MASKKPKLKVVVICEGCDKEILELTPGAEKKEGRECINQDAKHTCAFEYFTLQLPNVRFRDDE